MRAFSAGVGAAAIVGGIGLGVAHWATPTPVLSDVASSVQIVDTLAGGTSSGSGTVVERVRVGGTVHDYVLTAAHVLASSSPADPDHVVVKQDGGKTYTARIVYKDKEADLALLDIAANIAPVSISTAKLPAGTPDVVVGWPLAMGLSVSGGYLGGHQPAKASADMGLGLHPTRISSAAAWPGNSGGGVFDTHGYLIGVTEAIANVPGVFPQSADTLGFFIPASVVVKFLAAAEAQP